MYTGVNKGKDFQAGDLMWYFTPYRRRGQTRKLKNGWTGPWRIQRKVSDVLFIIEPIGDWANTAKVFQVPCVVDRLAKYNKNALPVINAPKVNLELRDCLDELDSELETNEYTSMEDELEGGGSYYRPAKTVTMQLAPAPLGTLLSREIANPIVLDDCQEPVDQPATDHNVQDELEEEATTPEDEEVRDLFEKSMSPTSPPLSLGDDISPPRFSTGTRPVFCSGGEEAQRRRGGGGRSMFC